MMPTYRLYAPLTISDVIVAAAADDARFNKTPASYGCDEESRAVRLLSLFNRLVSEHHERLINGTPFNATTQIDLPEHLGYNEALITLAAHILVDTVHHPVVSCPDPEHPTHLNVTWDRYVFRPLTEFEIEQRTSNELMLAVICGDTEYAYSLLDQDAVNLCLTGPFGRTCVYFVPATTPEVATRLAEAGNPLNHVDVTGVTPLQHLWSKWQGANQATILELQAEAYQQAKQQAHLQSLTTFYE